MSKALIIVTRTTDEFSSYWSGGNETLPNYENVFKPIIITVTDSLKAVIISPAGMLALTTTGFGEDIKNALEQSNINLTGQSVGIIVHGSDDFNIDNAGLPPLAFRKKYSSSLGDNFCQYQNDNFISPDTQPDPPRTGVLDAFRDAYVFNNENLEEAFNNLWNFFLGDPVLESKLNLLHLCLTPDGIEEAGKLLQDDWNAKDEFIALKEAKGNDAFDEKYIKALTTLRDTLLPS